MPKVNGFDFAFWLKTRTTYTESIARDVAKAILKIVEPFHKRRYVLRDIRPENIIVL